ncbi:hypothetical protein BCR35DRAFT_306906 [Leucosporidium creatinivorum]|uniref:Uncharacterized protein n=1 Tax=Leucosporidium creatinivorum TaxID=106004 RepID=A0A1Y2ES33_9BASI|nr:hypothetical protein BCR35DRAFT_306906 [Leucosporidium creatinivorum]
MSIYRPAKRSARRQSLRLLGKDILPHQQPNLATLPPDVLLRIMRLSLPRPTSATDPAIHERPRQLLSYALVCRYLAYWALPELAGEIRLPQPINLDALLAALRDGRAPRLASSVQQWTIKSLPGQITGLGSSSYHWVTMVLQSLRNLVEIYAEKQYIPLPPLAQIPNLKTLRLVQCSLERPSKLVQPTFTFAKLQNLALIDSQYATMSTWTDITDFIAPERFPALSSISLALTKSTRGFDNGQARVRLLTALAGLPSLSSLIIGDHERTIHQAIEQVWPNFGPALTELTLDCQADMITSALENLAHPLQSLTVFEPRDSAFAKGDYYCCAERGLAALVAAVKADFRSVSALKRVVMNPVRDHEVKMGWECTSCEVGRKVLEDLVELLQARGIELVQLKAEARRLRPEEGWTID